MEDVILVDFCQTLANQALITTVLPHVKDEAMG